MNNSIGYYICFTLNLLIVIGYLILLIWAIRKWSFFTNSKISPNVLTFIFVFKFGLGLFLTWIYTQHYPERSEADIFKYFDDSEYLYNALFTEPSDFFKMLFSYDNNNDYFFSEYYSKMNNWDRSYDSNIYNDSHTIIRLNAVLRIFSFGVFHVHTLFFCFLTMIGLTALYRTVKDFFTRKKGALIGAIYFVPSVLFWSSGVLKESILLLGLGLLMFSLDKLMKQKFSFNSVLLLLFSFALLFYIKFYVLIAFIPCILAYIIVQVWQPKIKSLVYGSMLAMSTLFAFNAEKIPPHINFVEVLVRKQMDFKRLIRYQNAGSKFELTDITPSFLGIAKVVPEALANCFIRPLPWRANNILYYPAIFENLLVLFLIGLSIVHWIRKKVQVPEEIRNLLLFSVFFTLILFVIIGLTTPVAGALVRYKVPALPFLFIALIALIDLESITKKYPILKFLN